MAVRPLTVLIVAFGQPDMTARAVAAIAGRYPVLVVDNSRSPAVAAAVTHAGAGYEAAGSNIGYAAAVNLGLRSLGFGQDVLLLNPDAVISAEAVTALHDRLGPTVAAVAPALMSPDGTREPTRWPLPTPLSPWLGVIGRGRATRRSRCFLNGAVLLVSAEALQAVGGFDERFFLYAEECDWQRRALDAGWSIIAAEDLVAEHEGGATSSDHATREVLFHRSAELYVRKWFGRTGWTLFRWGACLAALRRSVTSRSAEQRSGARLTAWLYVRGPISAASQAGLPEQVPVLERG